MPGVFAPGGSMISASLLLIAVSTGALIGVLRTVVRSLSIAMNVAVDLELSIGDGPD